jgi:AAA domain
VTLKIAVSGAHSTGKTTFLLKVSKALESSGLQHWIVGDLAAKCPLPILRQHTVQSALWIAAQGIADEIAAHRSPIVLVDRPVLDAWAYLTAAISDIDKLSSAELNTLISIIRSWLPTYSLVYQTQINEAIPIDDNKGRDLDSNYRTEIGHQMIAASNFFGVSPIPLTDTNAEEEADRLLGKLISGFIDRS